MYSRRRARESALQILYGLDWVVRDTDVAIEDYWAKFAGEKPDGYDDVRKHCEELVRGVLDEKNKLDERLQATSHHWKMDRMSAVDRNILRLAAFELLYQGDAVPRKVAINEAVEIAKKFGNEDSSAFVNGILDRIAQERGTTPADEAAQREARVRAERRAPKAES
jgi:N utilization substance protein B